MSLDKTGKSLAAAIVANLPKPTTNPIAANAVPPSFAYAPNITASLTTAMAGIIYPIINYGQTITQFTDGYLIGDPDIADGYYQFIPDGYYSNAQNSTAMQSWIAVSQAIVNYFIQNCDVTINNVTGIIDSTGHNCLSGDGYGMPTGGGLS